VATGGGGVRVAAHRHGRDPTAAGCPGRGEDALTPPCPQGIRYWTLPPLMNLSPMEARPRTRASNGDADGGAAGSVLRGGLLRLRLPECAFPKVVRG
jgi:hypothetical protein